MEISHGNGKSIYGPGVAIDLTGVEVAIAIDAYLVAHGVYVNGARTITVNGEIIKNGAVYVDPIGFVINKGIPISGRGPDSSDS